MSDEEIEQAIEAIQTMLAARAGEAAKVMEGSTDAPTAVLFDPTGEVGHAYGARTTPHMYVIDGEGALVYQGGIDDKPTARLEDLKSARNFVDQALSEISQGKPVSVTTSRAYGCSIKYGSFRGGVLPKSAHRAGHSRCSDIRL